MLKQELLHRQFGYYSFLDLLNTIPDIPWRYSLLDKAGYPLLNSMCPLTQTRNGWNTDEMISRQRLRTKKSEQQKVVDEGNYVMEAIQGHPLCSFDSTKPSVDR